MEAFILLPHVQAAQPMHSPQYLCRVQLLHLSIDIQHAWLVFLVVVEFTQVLECPFWHLQSWQLWTLTCITFSKRSSYHHTDDPRLTVLFLPAERLNAAERGKAHASIFKHVV